VNGSAHGPEIDQLIALLHWLMAVLFVGWSLYFIFVLFRFRAGRNPQASYAGSKSQFSTYVEAGVVIVEVILLVGFAIPAWARWVTPHTPETNALQVRVVGEQFAWNVQYPGADGVFGQRDINLVDASNPLGLDRSDPFAKDDVTTINQLHMPVDRPITVLLSSKDVIHSFALPAMRVKQDAIPGMEIPVHFKPILVTPEASQFPGCAASKTCWEIACAQLCGLGHYRMRGFYQVHSQESFDGWMSEQVAALSPPGS
jgi:cytochrome c oxidase subunit 2